ncbi:GUN4 domain-containing protein, partial [Cyanobacteria bacterium FACHB-502]|nr:GUN4 domain-containing protein [Cyanobacteria bacterium FACHB-502]
VKLAFLLGSGYNIKRLENFPLQDLNIINDLWINYSGGLYGFNVQKDIWLKLSEGRDELEVFDVFCQRVGWHLKWNWFEYPKQILKLQNLLNIKKLVEFESLSLAQTETHFKRMVDVEIKDPYKEGCYPFLAIRCFRSGNRKLLDPFDSDVEGRISGQRAKRSAIQAIKVIIRGLAK